MSSAYEVKDLLNTDSPTVEVAGEELPVAARTQIVVAGGGPAGTMAAIAAGRQGADVVLIESQPFLGGIRADLPRNGGGGHRDRWHHQHLLLRG